MGKSTSESKMTTLQIDTEEGWGDIEQQIMEMGTDELLSIYDVFEQNPTVFTTVANELTWRKEHERKLQYEGQTGEIEQRFL